MSATWENDDDGTDGTGGERLGWSGGVVTCPSCGAGCVPTAARAGWSLPAHTDGSGNECGASWRSVAGEARPGQSVQPASLAGVVQRPPAQDIGGVGGIEAPAQGYGRGTP